MKITILFLSIALFIGCKNEKKQVVLKKPLTTAKPLIQQESISLNKPKEKESIPSDVEKLKINHGNATIVRDSLVNHPLGKIRNIISLVNNTSWKKSYKTFLNRHVDYQIDSLLKYTKNTDTITLYKTVGETFVYNFSLNTSKLTLKNFLKVGQTKKNFYFLNKVYSKSNLQKINIIDVEDLNSLEIRFENDTIKKIKYCPYVD